jgi:hypothetical protein
MAAARRILVCFAVAAVLLPVAPGLGGITERRPPTPAVQTEPALWIQALAPGHAATGTLRVANAGDSPARFRLTVEAQGDTTLARALVLVVVDDHGRLFYRGSLAGATATAGVLAPGETRVYRLSVRLPRTSSETLAGATAAPTFAWTATGV